MSNKDSGFRGGLIPKLLISLVIAVTVSLTLGSITVYTLKSNLLLRNQVELGLGVRARADNIAQIIQARKKEIHLLGKPETLSLSFALDKDSSLELREIYRSQTLIMNFLSERYDGIYVMDSNLNVVSGIRRDSLGRVIRIGSVSLASELPFKIRREFFDLRGGDGEPMARLVPINREGYTAFEVVFSSTRVMETGEVLHVLAHVSPEKLMRGLRESLADTKDDFFLVSLKGQVVTHSRMKMVGRDLSSRPWIRNRLIELGGGEEYKDSDGSHLINAALISELQCLLCVIRPFNSFTRDLDQIKGISILVALAIFAMAITVGWYMVNLILKYQSQRLEAQVQQSTAQQALAYSQELESKNRELSSVNSQLETLHGDNLAEKNRVLAIINTITDAIVVTDSDFAVSFMNSMACYLFGAEFSHAQGRHVSEVWTEKWFLESFMKLSQGPLEILREERRISAPSGELLHMECTFLPLVYEKGSPQGYVVTLRDVTRERELDRLKSEFISMVSHELRTPLASIKGTVEIMIAGILGVVSQEQREFLQVMLGETDRLIRLISDILDLEKMESGKLILHREHLDVTEIIRQVVSSSVALASEKGLRIVTDLPEESVGADLDADKFRQVIHNLINNAIKYTDQGRITAGLSHTQEALLIRIADTGVGIDSARQSVIFDKFYQVDSSSTRKTGGTGLGLPITRRLVELHGGTVWVDSIPGKGSTFFVELPRRWSGTAGPVELNQGSGKEPPVARTSEVVHETKGLAAQSGRMTRALVIEDDQALGATIARVLEEHFDSVFRAETAAEGLRSTESFTPDLLILDLNLPDRSGLETIPLIRSISPDTRVVVVTGNSDLSTAVEAMKNGASDYVLKPFDLERIKEVAESALASISGDRPAPGLPERGCDLSTIVGESRWTSELQEMIRKVSRVDEIVLITGESGVGKELVARSIHRNSSRFGRPFIAVNCGALARELLESELFGHVKGAFTGAWEDKNGLFQAASGGTLFLDEIGEAPPEVQVKLLRVIQEGQVTPVGGVTPLDVDVRLLAATNRDLKAMVRQGSFREDLYYRVDVLNIAIPPLRERPEDIEPIARGFITRRARELGRTLEPEPDFIEAIVSYTWPGNVRELENILARAVVECDGTLLKVEHLPPIIRESEYARTALDHLGDGSYREEKKRAVEAFDKVYIERVLINCGGNVAAAARRSGMHAKNLHDKIREYGINPDKYRS